MNYAIIVAAGKGKRMGNKLNKVLLLLNDEPVICHSIRPFEDSALIDRIILVANSDDVADLGNLMKEKRFRKVEIVEGGKERQDSVYNGLRLLKDAREDDIVIVHNGSNPFVSPGLIEEVVKAAKEDGACAAAFRAGDTVKEADEDDFVIRTFDRKRLWQMQTPQAARYRLLVRAFVKAYNDSYYGTDDAELIERLGEAVKIVECGRENFKITTPLDLENARMIMNADRAGIGMDSHRFTEEAKQLVLGGVVIPDEQGLEANSDGDVVLHSLFNALSQSVGGRSLGYYADPLFRKGIMDSSVYLKTALDMVTEKGFEINGIGLMVEGKRPRLDGYAGQIRERVAGLCSIEPSQIGLTATSGEEMTAFGRGEGIQVFSVVILKKKNEG
ncbi:2-C-methyl-D-erythritol 4-phosphate cytidylyltransferase [Candidatus Woesearchaeota archaeon]|nr:2-C-methyl-D-erythritol 4-phosphate cytidylyltransferase [Candidatus Woesearchaeota archaeon]